MKLLKITTPLIFIALAAGCTSIPKPGTPEHKVYIQDQRLEQAEHQINTAPEWFTKPLCPAEAICATATAISLDMQLAIDKATLDAKYILADKMKGGISAKLSSFIEQVGGVDDPKLNTESVKVIKNIITNISTNGYEISQQEVLPSKQGFRAYVLAKYPLGDANRLLVSEATKNKTLSSRVSANKAFKNLELEIKNIK